MKFTEEENERCREENRQHEQESEREELLAVTAERDRYKAERDELIKACQLARSAIETATEMGTAESFGLVAAHKKLREVLK